MRVLQDVKPTAEQLLILGRNQSGAEIIRGAAGSGKTTTAILRLRALIGFFQNKHRRAGGKDPVRVLVLTYNRTLRGYVQKLVERQANTSSPSLELEVTTFARWAMSVVQNPKIVSPEGRMAKLEELGSKTGLPTDFVADETEYVLGRFLPDNLDDYLDSRRDGRGPVPRMERSSREVLLRDVVRKYQAWLDESGLYDWHEFAWKMASTDLKEKYDVVVVDETQDFSANQVRAILRQAKRDASLTFVVDTVQRIYARGFTWAEVGMTVRPEMVKRLRTNYRNTKEIAAIAVSICAGITIDDDGTMPDFNAVTRTGNMPVLLKGRYSKQADFAVEYIKNHVDLDVESVAFLHTKGWFREISNRLDRADIDYTTITRKSEWPDGPENVALCTMHSAKGLEFDHVIIIGLNAETLGIFEDVEDDRALKERRLLAMAVSRAKSGLIIGFKPEDRPRIVDYLDESLFEVRNV